MKGLVGYKGRCNSRDQKTKELSDLIWSLRIIKSSESMSPFEVGNMLVQVYKDKRTDRNINDSSEKTNCAMLIWGMTYLYHVSGDPFKPTSPGLQRNPTKNQEPKHVVLILIYSQCTSETLML